MKKLFTILALAYGLCPFAEATDDTITYTISTPTHQPMPDSSIPVAAYQQEAAIRFTLDDALFNNPDLVTTTTSNGSTSFLTENLLLDSFSITGSTGQGLIVYGDFGIRTQDGTVLADSSMGNIKVERYGNNTEGVDAGYQKYHITFEDVTLTKGGTYEFYFTNYSQFRAVSVPGQGDIVACFPLTKVDGYNPMQVVQGFDEAYLGGNYMMNNVSLTLSGANSASAPGTIPEPATATLSLLALAGLAARRRRK